MEEKIQQIYDIHEEEVNELLSILMMNLEKGNFKFIVLMDHLGDRLKDLVYYVNENSRFDIYPVELEFYKYLEYEIIIPKIYGTEVKKRLTTGKGSAGRFQWSEETLIEKIKEDQKDDFEEYLGLYRYLRDNSDSMGFGTGRRTASYTPYLYSLADSQFPFSVRSNGELLLKFSWERFQRLFGQELEVLSSFVVSELDVDVVDEYPVARFLEKETRVKIVDFRDGVESVKRLFRKIQEMSDKK